MKVFRSINRQPFTKIVFVFDALPHVYDRASYTKLFSFLKGSKLTETLLSLSGSVTGEIRRRRISLEASFRGGYEKIGVDAISVDVIAKEKRE